jgi:hypothetical protein
MMRCASPHFFLFFFRTPDKWIYPLARFPVLCEEPRAKRSRMKQSMFSVIPAQAGISPFKGGIWNPFISFRDCKFSFSGCFKKITIFAWIKPEKLVAYEYNAETACWHTGF